MAYGVRSPKRHHTIKFLTGIASDHYLAMSGQEFSEEECKAELTRKIDRQAQRAVDRSIRSMGKVKQSKLSTEIEWMDMMGKPIFEAKAKPVKPKAKRKPLPPVPSFSALIGMNIAMDRPDLAGRYSCLEKNKTFQPVKYLLHCFSVSVRQCLSSVKNTFNEGVNTMSMQFKKSVVFAIILLIALALPAMAHEAVSFHSHDSSMSDLIALFSLMGLIACCAAIGAIYVKGHNRAISHKTYRKGVKA